MFIDMSFENCFYSTSLPIASEALQTTLYELCCYY